MNSDNKNSITGALLIVLILIVYNWLNAPSKVQLAQRKHVEDSIQAAKANPATMAQAAAVNQSIIQPAQIPDSIRKLELASRFGVFSAAAAGTEQFNTIENDVLKVTFTNKGGRIKQVILKKYNRLKEDANHKDISEDLVLLNAPDDQFEYLLPNTTGKGSISTNDLYFTPIVSGNTIDYKATAANGATFAQKYTIGATYGLDYDISYSGFDPNLPGTNKALTLTWVDYLGKLEKNETYERNNTSLYYRLDATTPTYCSCSSNDRKELADKPVKWVSNANQFFNSSLIAKTTPFKSAVVSTEMMDLKNDYLKKLTSVISIPMETGAGSFAMQMYIGPNVFDRLRSYQIGLEDVISYGGTILGTINRWVIRPIFDFLHSIIGSAGICILLLTLLVKSFLYPLNYRMLRSQSKTTALKPEIDKLKARTKDPQQVQVETMKLYNEFGVNPLGGCLPTLMQMPIWMALFRFFPSTIDFRHQGFLWAKDLTDYEVFAHLPFNIPFYGSHISLFAFLWAISLIVFTYYSTKDVDMSAQPAMKYVQYVSPLMFMFIFNSYAAGLSLYMLFSNILNIGQTLITKNYVIDHNKIQEELQAAKKKPKSKSGFRQRLEQAVQQQQQLKEGTKKK